MSRSLAIDVYPDQPPAHRDLRQHARARGRPDPHPPASGRRRGGARRGGLADRCRPRADDAQGRHRLGRAGRRAEGSAADLRSRCHPDRQRRQRDGRRAGRAAAGRSRQRRRRAAQIGGSAPRRGIQDHRAVPRPRHRRVARADATRQSTPRIAIRWRRRLLQVAGALRRSPGTHYRGADYDFVSIVSPDSRRGSELAYSLDTRRARTDVVRQVRADAAAPAAARRSDAAAGAAGYRTHAVQPARSDRARAVPRRLDRHRARAGRGTAGIPWELLDTNTRRPRPGARPGRSARRSSASCGSIHPEPARRDGDCRRLRAGDRRAAVRSRQMYLRLPVRAAKPTAVAERFERSRGPRVVGPSPPTTTTLPGPDSVAVLSALHRHPYRIIHIAGHGEPTITEQAARAASCCRRSDAEKRETLPRSEARSESMRDRARARVHQLLPRRRA